MVYVCERCFGPLEVHYNLDNVTLDRDKIAQRPRTIWRYKELLPIVDDASIIDLDTGLTPLHRCRNLGKALGLKDLYVKDDTTNPTNSFKDRPTSVALSKARDFGVTAVGCPSTGNLAASVAAHAAKAGLPCYVFIPAHTEINKILQASIYGARVISVDGTYDETNRLAAEVAEEHGWAFANINLRPYYVEGSKTLAFEICEQLGWENPDNVIIPLGSGALLCAMDRGFKQFKEVGLTEGKLPRLIGAQGEGSDPIVRAFKKGSIEVAPIEKPATIAKSLAIGDPGDGKYVLKAIRNSNGLAESVNDEEILASIRLIAEKEGIFVEPAGGVTVGVLKKLADQGKLSPEEKTVCCVTGNGFKAADTILRTLSPLRRIEPTLKAFERYLEA